MDDFAYRLGISVQGETSGVKYFQAPATAMQCNRQISTLQFMDTGDYRGSPFKTGHHQLYTALHNYIPHFGTHLINKLRADSSWGGQYQRLNYSLISVIQQGKRLKTFEPQVALLRLPFANVNGRKRRKLAWPLLYAVVGWRGAWVLRLGETWWDKILSRPVLRSSMIILDFSWF